MENDLLANLNPEQRVAVQNTEGPLVILAGAGSGKTRVISHRIAYLISEKGVPPHQILAVTFTNKAAGEMKERVQILLGDRAKGIWVNTFHASCARILRRHAEKIGFPRNFVVYDASDQTSLVKQCCSELNINEELYAPRKILGRIGNLKQRLIGPESFGQDASPFGLDQQVYRVYLQYQQELLKAGGMDFEDLIGKTVYLFEKDPELLAHYQERFHYIMVDEYQDTNHAQYRLVNLLARGHNNLCVVGDDDQSIYAFRGADISNILSFEQDFPQSKVVTLGQNYRSTQNILNSATVVIAKNLRRKEKRLFTENGTGERPMWCRVENEQDEALYLCRTIQRIKREEGRRYGDFCILYRTNAQSRVIEEAFRSEEIPFLIVGGLRFYDRKEVKDLIAYLRVIINPADNISFKRIINTPARGIGSVTLERLSNWASERRVSLSEALSEAVKTDTISASARKGLSLFYHFMEELRQQMEQLPPAGLLERIIRDTQYEEALRKEYGSGAQARIENVQELLAATSEMEGPEGLRLFLDQVALVNDQDEANDVGGAVTLMTLHSAKGLEFPVVFIVGMEERLFPHSGALSDVEEMEEERRLCYVGITRAKERLYFVSAVQRRLYGNTRWGTTSRFVEELLPDYVERDEFSTDEWGAKKERGEEEVPAFDHSTGSNRSYVGDNDLFPVGSYVRHPVFGVGRVQRREGSGEGQYLTVSFGTVGTKKLSLKYATLKRL